MPTTYINSTDVRKDFSTTIDNAIFCKPQFIKRTHNHMVFIEEGELNRLLSGLKISIYYENEVDGSFIARNSVVEDVFAPGSTKEEALDNLIDDLIDYSKEYYEEYELYSKAPNRCNHAPYVMKILLAPNKKAVRELLDA